jgi:serine/threonine protein phosphatase PrpC
MKLYFTGATDTGMIRSSNQDAYCVDPEGRFFVVADGMGGHAGGQEASSIATKVVQDYLSAHWQDSQTSAALLEQAIRKANQAILQDQQAHPERSDMGTTIVVVAFRSVPGQENHSTQPWCAHVGDSRLYRLRGAKLDQITEDHTWVNRATKMGVIQPEQSRTHPWRHVLSQCLGRKDLQQIDIQEFEVQPGDRLLLCSDGLTEELPDDLIAGHLKKIRACEMAAQTLISAAKERGGRDNITVVIVATDINDGSSHSQASTASSDHV